MTGGRSADGLPRRDSEGRLNRVLPRPDMRRAVVLLPNGFTLGNLFFGIFAIVSASRGDFSRAGWYVVLGGVMDAFDGRVARATKTGSQFGVELDSLVDAVSFGVAPAFIMYFAVLNREGWAWLVCFIYVACVIMRLARFNVEQGGRAKTHFHGLPSPAAGMTLATYYWFSQSPWYQERLIGLPWQETMIVVMVGLSILMVSHVLYPAVPKVGFRNVRSIVGTLLVIAAVIVVIVHPKRFAFPVLLLYIVFGVVKSVIVGVVDRLPTGDPLYDVDEEDDDESDLIRPAAVAESPVTGGSGRKKRRRRRPRPDRGTPSADRPAIDPAIDPP